MSSENATIKGFGFKKIEANEKAIAIGAYGRVIAVRQQSSNEIFAMKIINKDLLRARSAKLQDLIYNEINIHSTLDHPNIVTLEKWFEDDTKIYIVLNYCSGGTLKKSIENGLSETDINKILTQICLGVEYLHSNNIIHRDLKPLNVLLTNKGDVKICDFGWSCSAHESYTKDCPGTSLYMAPEIVKKESHSFPCDISEGFAFEFFCASNHHLCLQEHYGKQNYAIVLKIPKIQNFHYP